jgi:hypothetical protein
VPRPLVTLRFGFIELRFRGTTDNGKGDRCELISARDARATAIRLLQAAERLELCRLKPSQRSRSQTELLP